MVARCAPPDRFFAFVDVLFRNQANWAGAGSPDAVQAGLKRIALLGGIGEEKFNSCISDKTLETKVLQERLVAQNDYGVDSTPTFFINGKKLVGALPYDEFQKALGAAATEAAPLRRLGSNQSFHSSE